MVWMLTGNT